MSELQNILKQFSDALVVDIKKVTKRFSNTIESNVRPFGFEITGSPYISTLIDGRPPTSPNAKKGSPTLQEAIYKWIGDKGIKAVANKNGTIPSQESLSWAISQSIHKHGDLLYQRGGGNNIFAGIITQSRIDAFANSLGSAFVADTRSEIIKEIK